MALVGRAASLTRTTSSDRKLLGYSVIACKGACKVQITVAITVDGAASNHTHTQTMQFI